MKSVNRKDFRGFCEVAVVVIAVALVVGLVVMAIFARPIADEYYFISQIRDNGILGYTAEQYLHWGGRLVQSVGSGLAYTVFGATGSQVIMPIVFLVLFGSVWSWLIYQVSRFKNRKLLLSIASGFLVACSIMYFTVCLFDIYLWLDSAIVHFLGMIMVVYDAALFIWLLSNKDVLRKKWLLVTLLLFIAFLGQMVSEVSTLLVIGWSFIAFMSTLIFKKWAEYRKATSIFFLAVLAGGLIMIMAPGLWARAGSSEDKLDWMHIILINPAKVIFKLFANELSLWKISMLVVFTFIGGTIIPIRLKKGNVKYVLCSLAFLFISLVYFPLVVYYLGSNASGVESRILAMPSMGIFLFLLLAMTCVYVWLKDKILVNHEKEFTICAFVVFIASCGVFGRGIYDFDKGYIATLSVRAAAVDLRDVEVMRYKEGLVDKLIVADLPVMIEKSNATDFSANNYTTPGWFYISFLSMYEIPSEDLEVVGGKLIGNDVPFWYKEDGLQICTVANKMVGEMYYCVNKYNNE